MSGAEPLQAELPSDSHATWLKSLHLRNYRRFEDLSIDFHQNLTVLVAENGGGKTAVLDAIAVAIRYLVDELRSLGTHGFVRSDVRLARAPNGAMVPVTPTSLDAVAIIDGHQTSWHRELASLDGRTSYAQAEQLGERGRSLRRALQDYADRKRQEPPTLPLIAYYGTGRLWSEHNLTERKKKAATDLTQPTGAYLDCLSPSSSYGHFVVWFERVVREAQNETQTGVESPHRPAQLANAVRRAADIVLRPSGWKSLDWDFLSGEVVASHDELGRLPVSLLSDGIRNLVALVADLAHRAVRLNAHLGTMACEKSPGIVLIDEVDMHLHPSWQQAVISLLREAFPNVQFIVTTHSHLVISTVPSASIRVFAQDGTVSHPSVEVEGADSPYALAVVFGVDSSPPIQVVRQLSKYRALIEDGRGESTDALALRTSLEAHFGHQHPAMAAAASLQRLQRLKGLKGRGGR